MICFKALTMLKNRRSGAFLVISICTLHSIYKGGDVVKEYQFDKGISLAFQLEAVESIYLFKKKSTLEAGFNVIADFMSDHRAKLVYDVFKNREEIRTYTLSLLDINIDVIVNNYIERCLIEAGIAPERFAADGGAFAIGGYFSKETKLRTIEKNARKYARKVQKGS